MRRNILSLLAGLAVVTAASAQFPVQVAVPNAGPSYAPQTPNMETTSYVGPLWTVDLQYLLYFVKPMHFNSAVIGTTANPDQDLGGQPSTFGFDDPGFVSVLGPGYKNRGPFQGVRLSITRAMAVNFARTAYIEAAGFWLPEQGSNRSLSSTPDGNPAILLPFATTSTSAVGPPGHHSVVVAGFDGANRIAGGINANTSTQIWGAELNVAGPLIQETCIGLEAIVGFRYLGLSDEFEAAAFSNSGAGFFVRDNFRTQNSFFGVQAGTRLVASKDRWAGMLSAKVGLGDTMARLNVGGSTTTPAGTIQGGFYSSAANLGDKSTDFFGVVVDLNAAIRFAVSQGVGMSVGYNFLSWSGVQRAGDQVPATLDPAINSLLNPAGAAAALGRIQQERQTDISTLWMHGLNFSVDFRF